MKKWIISLVVCATMGSASAGVIAAWDFNAVDNTATAGWTTFVLANGASSTVDYTGDDYLADGSITLTQVATGGWSAATRPAGAIQMDFSAPLLLAGAEEFEDGFDLAGTQDFTLTGLTTGKTYRLQFIGVVVHNADAQGRNLALALDGGATTVSLLNTAPLTTGNNGGYSAYAEFTATDHDMLITFSESGAGLKEVSGLIVETVPDVITGGAVVVPTGLSAVVSDSEVTLDWDDDLSGQLDYFTVYRSTSGGVTTNDALTNVVASAYIDSNVVNGTTYYYALSATDTNGTMTRLSDEISVIWQTVQALQHLDASVASSVTANADGEVSLWADQSGHGHDAIDSNGDAVLYPGTSLSPTGLAGMNMRTNQASLQLFDADGTDAFLDFTGAASGNSGFAVLIAFKADYVFDASTRNQLIGNSANTKSGFLMRYDQGTMEACLGGARLTKPALEKVESRDTLVFAFNYKASSGQMEFWDSKNKETSTATVAATDFSTNSVLRIGTSDNRSQFMDGMIGEVKIFDQALDPEDFASLRDEMTVKWVTVSEIQIPQGLTALVDDEWVQLNWLKDISGDLFASYSVYRSTTSGSGYVQIASGLTTSDYLDTGMPGGIPYYYVVTAVDTNGVESAFSAQLAVTPNQVVRLQHLDATVAGSVLVDGGVVTQWVSQVSGGNSAETSIGSVLYPSGSLAESGLAGLDMRSTRNSLQLFSADGSDSWLDQSSSTNGFCVMVAFKCDAVMAGNNNDVIGNSTDSSSGFGMHYTGSGAIESWLGGKLIPSAGPGVVVNGDTLVFALNYNAATEIYDFWDSKNYTSVTGTMAKDDFSLAVPVTLGSTTSSSRYLNGMVGEVKVFGSGLSSDEFERQRMAMLNKWTEKPNIIMFYVDDWAWNGSPVRMDERMVNSTVDLVEMPHLEHFIDEGMLFRNAYGSVMCVPARACLQTGLSSARHQLTVELARTDYYDPNYPELPVTPNGIRKPLPDEYLSIPRVLSPLGYKCAHYGKWHLGSDPYSVGYDETDGDLSNVPGTTLQDSAYIPPDFENPKRMNEITDRTLAFMDQAMTNDTPFYIQLSHYAQHKPYECLPSSRARYQNHPLIVAANNGKTDPDQISAGGDPAVWLGMLYDLDQTFGQVLQKLDELGIYDNTYVVLTSDNGYRHDDVSDLPQPLHGNKWWGWQAGLRVPMFVRGPGIPMGSICTANVINYDLMPTFLDWAGGASERLQNIDGVSLMKLMEGDAPAQSFLDRSLYVHYPHYRTTAPHSAMIKGDKKIMYFYDTPVIHPGWNPIMLFDLGSDVGEYHNITMEEQSLAQSLYSDMTNYMAQVGSRIPMTNAAYNASTYLNDDGYDYRTLRGAFVGTRTPEEDEYASTNDIPTFVDFWMESFGVDLDAETDDYDHDGVSNIMEYLLGSDPTDALDAVTNPSLEKSGSDLSYGYMKRNDDSSLQYILETTTNLISGAWIPAGGSSTVIKNAFGVMDDVSHTLPTEEAQSYFRLKIVTD